MKTKFHSKKTYLHHNKELKPEFIGNTNAVRMRVVNQTILDTLLLNDTIMLSHYKVIERLQSDFNVSGLVGVKAMSFEPKVKSSRFDGGGNVRRQKVVGCIKYVTSKLDRIYKEVLMKLIENKSLSEKEKEWIKDENKVGTLSTIIDEFYEMWNNG
tara:strand:+ start:77 stop:544 length:468 start_codon:yes stop_codon:yes gene_type:complete